MRTFAGTLLLEDIFEYIPSQEAEIYNLGLAVLNPNVLIAEADCKTTLGKFETLNYESEGLTELATEQVLSYARITELLSAGTYTIATRHTSTCISKTGVCLKCLKATYPEMTELKVLDRTDIRSAYLANAEIIEVVPGVNVYDVKTESDTYNYYYVYHKGVLLKRNIEYVLNGNSITLNFDISEHGNVVIRFMKLSKTPHVGWLANTYSGSLLGMKPIPTQLLPLRPLFLASTLLENRLQSVSELIKRSNKIPKEYIGYMDQIKDPLEKALYMLAVFSIYYNVTI